MASGTFYGTTSNSYIQPKIVWTSTANISSNTSTVTATLYYSRTNTGHTTSGQGTYSVTINDDTKTEYKNISISYNSNTLAVTHTVTVEHNDDGEKSIHIYAEGGIPNSSSFQTTTITSWVALDTIPRASIPTFSTGDSWINLGTAITIYTNRASTSFTHTLAYQFGADSGTIAQNVGDSAVWTLPMSLAQQMTTSTAKAGVIKCTTYSGSQLVGEQSRSFWGQVPSSVVPIVNDLAVTRVDGDVPESWNIYLKGKSKATLAIIGASGVYGSTIAGYSILGGGFSSTDSSFSTGYLNTVGTVSFTAKVTDSRGRQSADTTKTITVADYYNPKITAAAANRCLEDGTLNEAGTYVRVVLDYDIASCSGNNTSAGYVRYRASGTESWSAWQNLSNGVQAVIGNGAISVSNTYELEFKVQDYFTSSAYIATIPTAERILNIREDGAGVSFGKFSEHANAVEIAPEWEIFYKNRTLLDYFYPVGTVYTSYDGTFNPNTAWGGTWVRFAKGSVIVGVDENDSDFETAGKTGGTKTVSLTEAQGPSHAHMVTDVYGNAEDKVLVPSGNTYGVMYYNSETQRATGYSGNGAPHENMPPYITGYIWRRTA